MKAFDWILIVLSGLITFFALFQIMVTPEMFFRLSYKAYKARQLVIQKFYIAGILLLVVVYRVWG